MGAQTHFLQPGLGRDAPSCSLSIADSPLGARPLAAKIEWAVDSTSRKRGLLGRDGLAEETAIVIAPSSGVHTFGMRFPIDVIFATRDGRVLKVREAMPRSRIALSPRAFAVIEMAAGSAARARLRPGDRLAVTPAPMVDPR